MDESNEIVGSTKGFNIVLVNPVIPQNTGTIGRLAAATSCPLHLIKPLGFELSDRYLKRAGLDYWPEIKLQVHEDWEAFLTTSGAVIDRLFFFTTHASRPYYEIAMKAGDCFVFGNETGGLPPWFHEQYHDSRYRIPMDNPRIRSLNLSNAVSIVIYEGRRQLACASRNPLSSGSSTHNITQVKLAGA